MTLDRRAFLGSITAGALAAAARAPRAAGAASGKPIHFFGWTFGVPVVTEVVQDYERRTGRKVDYGNMPWAQYAEGMTAKFVGKAPLDVVYVSDSDMVAWADAGWIVPIDEFPETGAYRRDLLPAVLEAATHKGRLYGLPYYADYMAFVYNDEMLRKAGIEAPPQTWDELVRQALAIKQRRIVEYPLLLHLEATTWMIEVLYAQVYSRGGRLFDDKFEPVFDQADSAALETLRWLIDAKDTHRILHPGTLEIGEIAGLKAFGSGQAAFYLTGRYRLKDLNTPESSQVAGRVKLGLMPSARAGNHQTVGWARLFSMTAQAAADPERRAQAWDFIQYMGGKSDRGTYEIPKLFTQKFFNGVGWKPLFSDPDVRALIGRYSDPVLQEKQSGLARPKDGLKARWFTEWDQFNRVVWQKAILRQTEPLVALKSSADKWRSLRRA